MNGSARRDPFGEDVRREAADWFARMRGPDADQLRPAFQKWRAADPANAEAYERHLQNWERAAFLANTGLASERDLGRITRKPLHQRFALAASVAALLTGGTAVYLLQTPSPLSARILELQVVTTDGRRVIALDDRSKITVEARSALDLSFSPRKRRANLKRGRARFEMVGADPRPLVVEVARNRVVAGEASFDIALDGDKLRVASLSGTLSFEPQNPTGNTPRRIEPGERIVLPVAASATFSPSTEAPNASANMIAFNGEPVAAAIARFNQASRRPIVLEPSWPGTQRISGAFRTDDPAGFAAALVTMFGGRVDVSPSGTVTIRSVNRPRK